MHSRTLSRTKAALHAAGTSYVLRFLTLLIGFVVTPIVLGQVGRELYGFWAMVGSVIGYLGMVEFGITGSVATLIARKQRSMTAVSRIASNALVALSGAALMVALLSLAAAYVTPPILGVSPDISPLLSKLLLLAGIGLALSFPPRALKAVLRGTQRIATLRILEFCLSLLRTAVLLGLLRSGYGIMSLPWSAIIGSLAGLTLFLFATRRVHPALTLSVSLISWPELMAILSVSAWWFLGSLGAMLIYQTDNIVIGRYLGPAMVTTYSLTMRLPELMREQLYQLNRILAPAIGDMVGRSERGKLQDLYKTASEVILFLAVSAALLIVRLNKGFVSLWVGSNNYGGDLLTVVFSCSLVYLAYFHLSSILLTNFLDLKLLASIRFGEGALNLVLSLILVQRFGSVGVAIGTLLAGLLTSAWLLPLRACRRLSASWRTLVGPGLARAAMFTIVAGSPLLAFRPHLTATWRNLCLDGVITGVWLLIAGWLTILPRSELRKRLAIIYSRPAIVKRAE